MIAEEIIVRPVVTEKSNDGLQEGKYTFEVSKKATKVEIAKAVEKLFNVKVLKVNTMTVKGKTKRVRYQAGKTSDWKKAIVTIDTNPGEYTYLTKGGKQVKVSKKYENRIRVLAGHLRMMANKIESGYYKISEEQRKMIVTLINEINLEEPRNKNNINSELKENDELER